MIFLLIILTLLLDTIISKSAYQIPSYYGHWNLNFFHYENLTKGQLKYFELHESVDMDPDGTIYIADKDRHSIYKTTQNGYTILAGITDRPGKRAGLSKNSLWNGPSSVVFYSPNRQSAIRQNQMSIIFVKNNDCSIETSDCILKSSQLNNLTLDNIRFNPPVIQFPNITKTQQYLYVSDTKNHCIKMIDLIQDIVSIVAGKCGQAGFLDGPFQVNRLNNPKNLGVTRNNEVYFFDSGNQYIRKLYNGQVYTMLNGACMQYGTGRRIKNLYNLTNIICYNNWVQGQTNNPVSHYVDPETTVDMCTLIYPLCLTQN